MTTRRDFLARSFALAAGGSVLRGDVLRGEGLLGEAVRWLAVDGAADDRVLLVVQLTGGNDGLNMVVPFEDDLYHRARPRLRIAKDRVVRINDALGFHPDMAPLRAALDEGALAVVTDVGYPRADRSHFHSLEVWHTARIDGATPGRDDDSGGVLTGWLGRAAERMGLRDGVAPALHVGSTEQPLALVGERAVAPSLVDLERATVRADSAAEREWLASIAAAPREAATTRRIAETARAAYAFSERIRGVPADSTKANYPATDLARQLRSVSRALAARLPIRVFEVELGGFDTHANQPDTQAALLRELSGALAAFHADQRAAGRADKVATLVLSEFGRRVRENSSAGTDHGAAGPVLLLGGGVRGGIHGGPPDLAHLDDGDVAMKVDFRRVYATLLDRWLAVPSEPVLNARFESFPDVLRV